MANDTFGNREGIIAALLNTHGPVSGYDLMKLLETLPRRLMSAQESSVYPVLRSLSKKGYISGQEARHVYADKSKTIWSLTSLGREALLRWVCLPMSAFEYRQSHVIFEVKCVHSYFLEDEHRRTFLEAQLSILRAYRGQMPSLMGQVSPIQNPFIYPVVTAGVSSIDGDVLMLETLLAMVRATPQQVGA